jgi:hypothetical protein
MHTRSANVTLTLLAGFSVSACSAFFVPNADDDGVERCNTTEDCTEPEDNRHVAQCVYGEGQPENSEKICSAAFREINCNPMAYGGDHPLVERYDDVTDTETKALYGECSTMDPDNRGLQGCAPNEDGSCDNPEHTVIDGYCDDEDAPFPALNPTQVGGVDIAGQDVLDQFCRFYFCDESFVCDTSGAKWICKPCDPNEAFGSGGCGTIYIEGMPSSVYTDVSESNCEGNIGIDEVVFGDEPVAMQ